MNQELQKQKEREKSCPLCEVSEGTIEILKKAKAKDKDKDNKKKEK